MGKKDLILFIRSVSSLLLLAPLVLLPDLLLLGRSEVVLDVEGLSDLLWCLSLDHVGHGLTSHVKKTLKQSTMDHVIVVDISWSKFAPCFNT